MAQVPPLTQIAQWQNNGDHKGESPRALLKINHMTMSVESITTTLNAYGVLDTCECVVPMKGNPDFSIELFRGETDTSAVPLTLYIGYPANPSQPATTSELQPIFVGQLDSWKGSHVSGKITFSGRSLGVALTDRKLTIPIQYKTSVQLIEEQAKAVGLKTNIVLAPGQEPVQMATVFSREYIAGLKNLRVWDLIAQCAQWDDTDAWVDGDTLYYVSPVFVPRNTVNIEIGKNVKDLDFQHASQFNRKIRVEVHSYMPRTSQGSFTRVQTHADGTVTKSSITRQSTSTPIFGTQGMTTTTYNYNGTTGTTTKSTGTSYKQGGTFQTSTRPEENSGIEIYPIYPRAPLTPKQTDDLALREWRRISMHEWSITIYMPVTKDLLTNMKRTTLLNVTGSPYSAVNQKYWPRRINWNFGLSDGVQWVIEAVNHQLPVGQV